MQQRRRRLRGRPERLGLVIQTKRPGFDAVCWDWNGTLLNDVAVARAAMNTVLRRRQLAVMPDEDFYRRVFGFPIREFYSRLGLGADVFAEAADDYLRLFAQTVGQASLQPGAEVTLTAIGELGLEQVLISATPIDVLEAQMAPHALDAHFSRILGITDVYSASKAHVVDHWLKDAGHDPRRVLMVGDTNHDEEIADALDVHFVRFDKGHQHSSERPRYPVVAELRDIVSYLRQPNTSRVL